MEDTFEEFLSGDEAPDRTLAVLDGDRPEPIRTLFRQAFGSLDVEIERVDGGTDAEDSVVLVEDGDVVASSPMEKLRNAVLMVNSDLYTTGTSGVDKYEAPEVLTELDEGVYTLRGFPASTKEKLLLIVMSRYIERRALEVGAGRLDVAFQQLSRIRDEYGTNRIYERLVESDVDVHVYGVPDVTPDFEGLTVHAGCADPYRSSWFVVFTPPGDGVEPAALVAVETASNTWRSRWTYDPADVDGIRTRIREAF
jgi:hypothetical protein